ncbi:MAG: Stk1 family PASTA domain-containing Ser/Thr kinase, partial [Actinomycetota bacterium]|nr:Stk1 family PASTA domain-containing Ser/Thr kinase [Actinomycetota bacterium]
MTEQSGAGRTLGDRYELGALIGRGGMADVRAGQDTRLGRTVAIKRLRSDLASDPTFQERFRREAQSAASLNHPAIVAVYDTGDEVTADGSHVPYIVMEYVDGQTLREIMHEGRKILPERAMEITADVLSALDYSHRAGIVHRDIKPANVMLTPTARVKVMDFGIARAIADSSSSMTATAAVVGTAQYLSPEQARGEQVDARSDIYSTGCLLFELLTGRPPFLGDSPVSVAYQHVREDPPVPSSLADDVSPAIDAVVAKALAKKTSDRYQSAAQMRADIERALAGQHVEPPVVAAAAATTALPSGTEQTSMFPASADDDEPEEEQRRRRWPWVVLGLLLVALLAGAVWLLTSGGGEDTTTIEVPDVVGERVEDAEAELTAAGFEVEVNREPSDEPRDRVTDQAPRPGEFEPEGTTVVLTVSAGPDVVVVPPGLVGASRAEAAGLLEDVGLTPEFDFAPSGEPRGEVIAAEPGSGEEVEPGSAVELTLSEGPILVPSVVGETQQDAEALINEAGLVPKVVEEASDVEEGVVVDQDPQANTEVEAGTTVVITVSTGPDETT